MWDGKLRVIDDRVLDPALEVGSDYLCLRAIDGNKFELSIRGYEHLGNTADFYDEDKDEEIIPDVIDGKAIVREESREYVLGGNLSVFSESDKTEFNDLKMPDLVKFLDSLVWKESEGTRSYKAIFEEVKRFCSEYQS
tara:strand:- start:609 stop:1022 length:414 start_codon:yes stop_codon:yes gene_type:complete